MHLLDRTRFTLAGVAASVLLAILGAIALHPGLTGTARAAARPNIVVVMTDDQTYRQLAQMSNVQSDLVAQGTTYKRFFDSYPLCCPSRATFLTGQYFHNHGVFGTYKRLRDRRTLPVWLRRGGYKTALVGKYLNGYGNDRPHYVPPGWNEWYAAVGKSTQNVYDYRLNENGHLTHYGQGAADFKQDVITGLARDFIQRRAPKGKPFFLYTAYTAPHVATGPRSLPPNDCGRSPQPAPRHAHAFDSQSLPMGPAFDERRIRDKPPSVRRLPRLGPKAVSLITKRYRCMLESLQSVDEGIGGIVNELAAAGELGDTDILLTSDNGFFLGEHRIRGGKDRPYEEAIHVPLVIRGPGFGAGRAVTRLAVNPDLTRTVLDLAHVKPRLPPDGVSLLGGNKGRRAIAIESLHFQGARTARYKYVAHDSGDRELYDLREDPHELRNLAGEPSYRDVRARMRGALRDLRGCAGAGCH